MIARLKLTVALAAFFAFASHANAAQIFTYGNSLSFNAVSNVAGIGTTETAGAPGFNVPRWNNMTASGSSPFGGTITAGSVIDAKIPE